MIIDTLRKLGLRKEKKVVVGWREWVSLPSFGIKRIKAKIDTGAKSSALHAVDIEYYKRASKKYARFTIHPRQRDSTASKKVHGAVVEMVSVKSSSGHESLRPVVVMKLCVGNQTWPVKVTLVNRDLMGFRMLIGRDAIRNKFLVDPEKSFLLGRKMAKKQ